MKTLDPQPQEVKDNLEELLKDLDEKVPPKQLDRNLLIATWNIRGFGDLTRSWMSQEGDSPRRDLHSVHCIAEIIRRFDVIAIQEVKSNIRALRDTLKILGNEWSMILTDVNQGSVGNGERMAYLFDTRRVNLSGLAGELVVPDEWRSGVSKNVLVTLHVLYGTKASDRVKELKGIAQWLSSWAKDVNAYHQNLILLGDFNIEVRGDLHEQTFLSEGLYVPEGLRSKEVSRSIFNDTKFYDQIAWFNGSNGQPKLSLEFVRGGSYDFVATALKNRGLSKQKLSFMISDHYPLWAEFKL